MPKDLDPHHLDVRQFAEDGVPLEGSEPLVRLRRLHAEAQDGAQERTVQWQARGELLNPQHVQPQVWLHLDAETRLPLLCQRCLNPVEVPLAVHRSFRFVADEATAAAEDDTAEEDLLALSRSFDLVELVEDEMLMEVPVAPMHEVCPVEVQLSHVDPEFEVAEAQREHPFAALSRLKTGKQ